jgi:tetratricopeptide (TPR) repeat protein
MTYLDQLRGVADGLLAPLRQSDAILCPTHPDRIPTPDAFTLPEPLRPQIETTEQAAAWCTAHTEYVVQIMIACSEVGEHSRVVQFAHLAWPLSHLYGLPRLPIVDLGLASARKLADLRAEAMMETGRDGPLSQLARYDEAIEATNRAAAIYEEIGDVRGQGQAIHSRARVVCLKVERAADKQRARAELVQASTDVETARALFAKAGYRRGEALCMITAGRIAETLNDFERALEMFVTANAMLTEGLPAENKPADPYDGAVAALGAARIHNLLGQAQKAQDRLGQGEALMEQLRTEKGLGLVAETTGRILITAGDHAGALAAYQRAKEHFETTDAHGFARVTEQLERLSHAA